MHTEFTIGALLDNDVHKQRILTKHWEVQRTKLPSRREHLVDLHQKGFGGGKREGEATLKAAHVYSSLKKSFEDGCYLVSCMWMLQSEREKRELIHVYIM